MAIITSFCARLYGRRKSQRKTEKITEVLLEKGGEGESDEDVHSTHS